MNKWVWSRDLGGKCRKDQMKNERLLILQPPSEHSTLRHLWVMFHCHGWLLYSKFPIKISCLHFLFFFPQSSSPQRPLGSLVSRHCWMEMLGMLDWDGQWWSAKIQTLDMFFIIWFGENRREKGKTYDFLLHLGVVNTTCTSSCTRVCKTLLYPIPNKFMIHRWAVVSVSIFVKEVGFCWEYCYYLLLYRWLFIVGSNLKLYCTAHQINAYWKIPFSEMVGKNSL